MEALKEWLAENWHKYLGYVLPPADAVKQGSSFQSSPRISASDSPQGSIRESG